MIKSQILPISDNVSIQILHVDGGDNAYILRTSTSYVVIFPDEIIPLILGLRKIEDMETKKAFTGTSVDDKV